MNEANDSEHRLLVQAWQEARPHLLERIISFEKMLSSADFELYANKLAHHAHTFAGTLGCFGLENCSRSAKVLEGMLLRGESREALAHQAKLLHQLIFQAEPSAPKGSELEPIAVFAGNDFPLAELLAFGHSKGVVITPLEDIEPLMGNSWSAVVLDMAHPRAKEFPLPLELPIIALIERDTLEVRAQAVRTGAGTVCPRQGRLKTLFVALERIIDQTACPTRRMLVVDEDAAFLQSFQAALEEAGNQVVTEKSTRDLWNRLETFRPDVLFFDANMTQPSGEELCRVIRSDPRRSDLPLVFMTDRLDPELALRLYDAGADDNLIKSENTAIFLRKLRNQSNRLQYQREELLDALTHLDTRRRATQDLERLLSLAKRQKKTLTLVIIDLDRFKSVNDTHGHAMGDKVLNSFSHLVRQRFRHEDVLSRWGGEEFLVGQLACDGPQAVKKFEDLLREFKAQTFTSSEGSFHVTFSAGVSVFPEDGTEIGTLYRRADAALYQAKKGGRARVVLSDSSTEDPVPRSRRIDVLLIEDDKELANLILSACEAKGFLVGYYGDGLRALEDWIDGTVGRPRVLLLDNNLPGLNGLPLLRRIAQEDRLDDTRVLVFSGRMAPPEILECMELGALDFIQKPFSVMALVDRVELLLNSPNRSNSRGLPTR